MSALSKKEQDILYDIIEKITGTSQKGDFKKTALVHSVEKQIKRSNAKTLENYLCLIKTDPVEYKSFLSSITIHTTQWFREAHHFDLLEKYIIEFNPKQIKILSAACSTGQEPYSIGLALELLREKYEFDYTIEAFDIDPLSVETAKKGLYSVDELKFIPQKYLPNVLVGQGKMDGKFTLDLKIKNKCIFKTQNILESTFLDSNEKYNIIFCRNALIYFDHESCDKIVTSFLNQLYKDGMLALGHSEALIPTPSNLNIYGSTCYVKQSDATSISQNVESFAKRKYSQKALIIDDVPTARSPIKSLLSRQSFECFEAESAEEASELLKKHDFELITLDLGLPNENGSSWLKRQRKNGLKSHVIIISASDPDEASKVYGALEDGAQEYFTKEQLFQNLRAFNETVLALTKNLKNKLQSSNHDSKVNKKYLSGNRPPAEIILLGASTGGPNEVWNFVNSFPQPCPPIVIVQHTIPHFAAQFAKTVEKHSGLKLGGLVNGEILQKNHVYLSQGDYHITVIRSGNDLILTHQNTNKINEHRPSVDALFNSVAEIKIPAVAVLLTGMGNDGARGMAALHNTGIVHTLAQSEQSCIVYGMPKEAIELGCVEFIGNTTEIKNQVYKYVFKK